MTDVESDTTEGRITKGGWKERSEISKEMTNAVGAPTAGQILNEKLDTLISDMGSYFGHGGLMYSKGVAVKEKEY